MDAEAARVSFTLRASASASMSVAVSGADGAKLMDDSVVITLP